MNASIPGGHHGHETWHYLRERLLQLIDMRLLESRERSLCVFVASWLLDPAKSPRPTKATATGLRNVAASNSAIFIAHRQDIHAAADEIERFLA
jgi:hypothetical protein